MPIINATDNNSCLIILMVSLSFTSANNTQNVATNSVVSTWLSIRPVAAITSGKQSLKAGFAVVYILYKP